MRGMNGTSAKQLDLISSIQSLRSTVLISPPIQQKKFDHITDLFIITNLRRVDFVRVVFRQVARERQRLRSREASGMAFDLDDFNTYEDVSQFIF